MSDYNTALAHGTKGFKIVADTTETTYAFSAIIPITTAVIAEITFPTKIKPSYTGDQAVVGKSLTVGVTYPIFGDVIKLTSGSVMLIAR